MSKQIKRDQERYMQGMMHGDYQTCISIEQRYGLYGYPPEWVSTWMAAEIESPGSGEAKIDAMICGEDGPDAA